MDKFDNSDAYIINYKNLDSLLETIKEANQANNKLDNVIVDIVYNKLLNINQPISE